jgi:Na+-transporting methylmalonyl-CoA/oxaloacetate decarboxylase gamma subunit
MATDDGARPRGMSAVFIVLAVVGAVVVGVGLVAVAGLFTWTTSEEGPEEVAPTSQPQEPAKVWDREKLKAAVVGKTDVEVTWLLGPAVRVNEDNEGPAWCYRRITRNPETGAADGFTYLFFRNGKVAKLGF